MTAHDALRALEGALVAASNALDDARQAVEGEALDPLDLTLDATLRAVQGLLEADRG